MIRCKVTMEWVDNLGFGQYHLCGRQAKYNIQYKDIIRGKKQLKRDVCGIHYNTFLKKAKRFDINFKMIELQ